MKIMKVWIKIFLIWMIVQFFLQTFVTYILKIDNSAIWLWKEIFVLWFFVYVAWQIYRNKDFGIVQNNKYIYRLLWIFLAQVVLGFLFSFFTWTSFSTFLLAFKYDFFGYFIFFVWYFMAFYTPQGFATSIAKRFGRVIVVMLIWAFFWYALILVKPWWLKFFGYNPMINEWKVWQRPPAVYKTQQYYWYPRNQFLFERPISFGFFLIAFWPLFFMIYIRKKSLRSTYWRWILYWANIIFTFSRWAWIAFFLQIVALWILMYGKWFKKFFLKVLTPLVLVMLVFVVFWYRQIVQREFSNTWHLNLLQKWLSMFLESPIIGKWAWYVWPASYQWWIQFNPENQYVQVLVEFGIIVFLLWFVMFLFLSIYPLYLQWEDSKKLNKNTEFAYLVAMSVWMLWLAFQWLFLHSFVDRMIVYPFMIIYWLLLGNYIRFPSTKKSLK